MARRSRGSGKQAKARRKAETPKSGFARTLHRRNSPTVVQETEVTRFRRERDEALLRETANFEILHLISKSPGNLELVFRSILENATRICEAKFGLLFRFDGKTFQLVAEVGASAELAEFYERRGPFHPGGILARLLRTKDVVCVADASAEPVPPPSAKIGGAKSSLNVPMFKDEAMVGAITIYRQEVRPFTDRQIALLENFAAQAVIAIENARLLNELGKRTDDLTELLEQQTATSEVLSVISSSPGELEPVFKAMLESATRICEAKFGSLLRFDGEAFHLAAEVGAPVEYMEFYRHRGPFQPRPGGLLDHLMKTKQVSHTADDTAEPVPVPASEFGGARSIVEVPMLKDDALIGAIAIYRREVRPFTNRQIELLTNFAAQAVIAIENTRLLNELRERTKEVVKLNQQLEQRVADQVNEIERAAPALSAPTGSRSDCRVRD